MESWVVRKLNIMNIPKSGDELGPGNHLTGQKQISDFRVPVFIYLVAHLPLTVLSHKLIYL